MDPHFHRRQGGEVGHQQVGAGEYPPHHWLTRSQWPFVSALSAQWMKQLCSNQLPAAQEADCKWWWLECSPSLL